MSDCKKLLDYIAKHESDGDYNVVWSRIKKEDRPAKPLTEMTIGEVLEWQDRIDPHYPSEAAGRYQILEDTLRGLYTEAGLSPADPFDGINQDRLAVRLLRRRGLADFLVKRITAEKFANSLAKEWASLPCVSGPKKGRSFYGGDGLNRALADVESFLAVVRSVRTAEEETAR
jgi:hypothetical protein